MTIAEQLWLAGGVLFGTLWAIPAYHLGKADGLRMARKSWDEHYRYTRQLMNEFWKDSLRELERLKNNPEELSARVAELDEED